MKIAQDRLAELAALKESRSRCGTCKGTGGVDSGAPTPWGTYSELPCPECSGREVHHSNIGPCIVSPMCLEMQRTNPDKTSMYVYHDGDIKEVTKALVTEREFNRASGDCICDWCGKKFYDHPRYEREEWKSCITDGDGPTYPLRQLCDGRLVKL
jgi:hypothetical protein